MVVTAKTKHILIWTLVIWAAFVLIQSLFFKFQGHEETRIIFNTIADWMAETGFLAWAADSFASKGGYAVGSVELVAAVLLLVPGTRTYGAIITLVIISGAIFFHLFTPLGIDRVIDNQGKTDGGTLFYMACSVWLSSAAIIALQYMNSLKTADQNLAKG